MEILFCILIGYGLGCLSPAAFVAALKKKDLRSSGTQNLGATNTMLVVGRKWGIAVMLFDILKGAVAMLIARALYPKLALGRLIAGLSAVIGHVFPFYMGFRGGKGLATFGGMVLAYDPVIFLLLLVIGLIGMFILNYGIAMPMSAAFLFPILVWLKTGDWASAGLCAAASATIIVKHWSNIDKARAGTDVKVRSFFRNGLKRKDGC
ncbi:MAG: glycerol-3-phosphate acyltransferase [Oscillospiraceae bacterium]|nr:glycerol-3-phosphate acyltransferase [Oscillospiraceae bacterium]